MAAKAGNLSFSLVKSRGWNSASDFSPLSIEACLYTEGRLSFLHEGRGHQECIFLLEFFLETKTALIRHFESTRYEIHVALPYSGSGYLLCRDGDHVVLRFSGKTVMSSTWSDFVGDFLEFQEKLKIAMEEHFPRMCESVEFKLLF